MATNHNFTTEIVTAYKFSVDENEKAAWIKAIPQQNLFMLAKTTTCRTGFSFSHHNLCSSCLFKTLIKRHKTAKILRSLRCVQKNEFKDLIDIDKLLVGDKTAECFYCDFPILPNARLLFTRQERRN